MDTAEFRRAKSYGNGIRERFNAKHLIRQEISRLRPDLHDTRGIIAAFQDMAIRFDESVLETTDHIDLLAVGQDIVNLSVLDRCGSIADVNPTTEYGRRLLAVLLDQLSTNNDAYKSGLLAVLNVHDETQHERTRREVEVLSSFGEFLSLNSLFGPHANVYKELLRAQTVPETAPPHLARQVLYQLTKEGVGLLAALNETTTLPLAPRLRRKMQELLTGTITEVDAALLLWSLVESQQLRGWVLPAGYLFNETFSQSSKSGLNSDLLFVQPEVDDLIGIQVKTAASIETVKLYDPSAIFLIDGVVDLGNYQTGTNDTESPLITYPGNMITLMHRILTGRNLPDDIRNPEIAHQKDTTEQSARQERRRLQDLLLKRMEHSILAGALPKAA